MRALVLSAALAALVPAATSAQDSVQIEVACDPASGFPMAVRVTMQTPGAVVIPILAVIKYCERTQADARTRPGT